MRLRHIGTMALLLVATGSVAFIGYVLVQVYTPPELEGISSSLQIVLFVFSATAGMLALIKYWDSVEARIEQQHWEKLRYLEASFQSFRERNRDVIRAFEWAHILKEDYLPLCRKALAYDDGDEGERGKALPAESMRAIRELDDFLEYFENLYFAVDNGLIKVEDLFVFLRYYIDILDEAYKDPDDHRLRDYVDKYYFNVQTLLDICRKKLAKMAKHGQKKQ